MQTNRLLSLTIFVALVGCGDDKTPTNSGQDPTGNPSSDSNDSDEEESEGQSESGGNNNTSSPTTTGIGGQTTTAGTTSDPLPPNESSGEGGSSSSSGGGFIVEDDTPNGNIECDVFAQDCPDGFKCMPWANDGGGSWNAAKCTEVANDAGAPGDPCKAEGGGVSGVDDCELGTMCWFLDEKNEGTCIDMCKGTIDAPTCPDQSQICDISNDGVIIICLDTCYPLTQDCPDGQICFWDGGTEFICDFDASGDAGKYQDPCAYINVCDYGLWCAGPESVPDCVSDTGCCTPYCSLETPDCPAGTVCEAWYEEGNSPPGQEDIGGCVIPM
jgi:hypothetical protein